MSQASALLVGLSHEALWRLEEACSRFEQRWLSGQRPPLGDFVDSTQGVERLATLGELLRLDVHYRRLAGESPTRQDYATWLTGTALDDVLPDGAATTDGPDGGEADAERTTEHREGRPAGESSPRPDLRAGRFRVLRFHAAGGLGELFVAEDEEFHREVALKEIQRRLVGHEDSRQRFVLEAEITGNLEHPGIVPVYGLGTHPDGRPYYAMRFIQGDTLEEALRRFHTQAPVRFDSLEFRQLLGRLIAVCQTVAYAHSRGVLHRDLKPSNVMVGKFGETLVVDWGLAKVLGRAEPQDRAAGDDGYLRLQGSNAAETVGVVGTPAYMSPEQAFGRMNELGPATDVYSLGATLYAMLTGRAPFQGRASEVIPQVQAGHWAAPRQVNALVPEGLDAICRKAMALRPEDRYASAQALAEDVEHWLADEPVTAAPEPLAAQARRWMRKHPRSVAAAGASLVALVLGLTAGTILLEQSKREAEKNFEDTRAAALALLAAVNEEELVNEPGMWILRYRLLEKALTYYQRALKKRPDDLMVRAEMASVTRQLGELFREKGDGDRAAHDIGQARDAYEDLVARRPGDAELRLGLAQTLLAAADLSLQNGDPKAAEGDATRAVDELEQRRETRPNDPKLLKLLARALDARATAQSQLGRMDQAIDDNSRSGRLLYHALLVFFTEYHGEMPLERHPNLGEKRGQFGTSYLLFRAWLNQGRLQRLAGRPAEACASLASAGFMAERLHEMYPYLHQYNPRSARLRVGLAAVRLQAGWAWLDLGLPEAALPALESAVELARAAAEALAEESTVEPRWLLAVGTGFAGEAHFRRGHLSRAADLLSDAVARTGKLAGEDRAGELLALRGHFLALLGRLEAERGNPAPGLEWCEQAVAEQEKALQTRPGDRDLHADWLATRRLVARLRHRLGRDDATTCLAHLRMLMTESQGLAAQEPVQPFYQREVGAAAAELAAVLIEAGKPGEAVGVMDQVLPAHERLIAEDDVWQRLRSFRPGPADRDPLRNNPRAVVYHVDRLGLLKDFWARSPAREPEDLHLRQIGSDLLATKAVALARLGQADAARKLTAQAVAVAERLAAGPSGVPVLPAGASAGWGMIAAAVARREPCYLYDLACHQCLEATLRGEPADAAIATLRAMAAIGGGPERLRADPRLKALRSRPDFGGLVEMWEAKNRSARPGGVRSH